MTKVYASEQLIHEALDGDRLEGTPLAVGVHVPLEVAVHEFKNKHQLVFGVDNIMECDDILVFQLLHEGDFSNCGRWGSFFRVEMDFFQSNELSGLSISAFEDLDNARLVSRTKERTDCMGERLRGSGEVPWTYSCIGAFAQFFQLLERAGMAPTIHF